MPDPIVSNFDAFQILAALRWVYCDGWLFNVTVRYKMLGLLITIALLGMVGLGLWLYVNKFWGAIVLLILLYLIYTRTGLFEL